MNTTENLSTLISYMYHRTNCLLRAQLILSLERWAEPSKTIFETNLDFPLKKHKLFALKQGQQNCLRCCLPKNSHWRKIFFFSYLQKNNMLTFGALG